MYACYSDHLPVQLLLSERQMHFQIQYNTSFGEFLVVVGSIESFGSWNPKNAVKMNWNPGNVWTWHTFLKDDQPEFEYKYVMIGYEDTVT